MNKLEVIDMLSKVTFACKNERDYEDQAKFEPIITANPIVGIKCLEIWANNYFVSFNAKAMMDKFKDEPTWDNFHLAGHFLMIDRIIAGVALDGQVKGLQECIELTLKCGRINLELITWVEYYTGINSSNQLSA